MSRVVAPTDPVAERRHRTDIGIAARLAGELALADRELTRAAGLAAKESPAVALRARLRLAHVHHWLGRYTEAGAEFDRCVADSATAADRALAHQHAGRCAYDAGEFDRAAGHFQAAVALHATEESRAALTAADACRTAVVVAEELDRLVPGGHCRIRDVLRAGHTTRPRHFGVLVELRGPLLAGPVSLGLVPGLFRYAPGIDTVIGELVADGWLVRSANALAATRRTTEVLDVLMAAAGRALDPVWGRPVDLLGRVSAVVAGAVGTSEGPVFDALATVDPPGSPAVRLFERCNALRHHRADAHAAAWHAVGRTATSVADVPRADPIRRGVETATNRIASRAFRPLSTVDRAELCALLLRLPV
jgi:hypothetical protein